MPTTEFELLNPEITGEQIAKLIHASSYVCDWSGDTFYSKVGEEKEKKIAYRDGSKIYVFIETDVDGKEKSNATLLVIEKIANRVNQKNNTDPYLQTR